MAVAKMVTRAQVPTSCYRQCRSMAVLVLVAILMSWMSTVSAQDPTAPAGDAAAADPNQGNPCSIGWFRAHGWLMWLAFGIFLPLGVFVSRYGQYYFSQWFWAHISLQVTGVVLATISFAIAANKFQVTTWDNTHVKLGLAIMILVWLQPLLSFVRPRRGSGIRPVWFFVHWLFGMTAIVLAWFNIFKGLDVYVGNWPDGGERKASYVLWGINVAVLAFLYLFLDRLPYIRAQSMDPEAVNPRKGIAMTAADETPYHKPGVEGPTRQAQV
ncbi:hypothetical protein M758_7G005900 [Ceratodon purpureus]|nr:hypothetical protein M758_7G005900 [Ceratodon purpureus]